MTLASGSKVGPYEIVAPVGAGGMGEVYRARDAELGRDVAIKVLPAAFSEDPDRMRRFKQEAQAAAALNHPNILTIYHVGEHAGSPYIVSELLEGESLRQRLLAGPLPVRKAIEYGVQVARGLAAAHGRGIVHRDLKPENLFVGRDGRVKILDFGLAKLTQPEGRAAAAEFPSMTAASEPGLVLGTVGYMSPEQVRGQAAGPPSDLFSFGAILYEMLTGKRAFQGETAADTMSTILKEDPPELTEANRQILPALERIVRHCLEKNPEERFQSARDVAFALEALSSVSGSALPLSAPARKPGRFLVLGAGVILGVLAASGLLALRRGPVSRPVYHRLTFRQGTIQEARFSPDGQTVVYSAASEGKPPEIFTTRPPSPESRAIGLSDTSLLAVSPTGELAVLLGSHPVQIAINAGTIARVPLEGGAPREILANGESGDWSNDQSSLLIVRQSGEHDRLEFPSGKLIYENGGAIGHARLSPGGDRIAFFDYPDRTNDSGSVIAADLAGKATTLSTGWADLNGLAWSPRGDEVWFTGDRNNSAAGLFAVSLSGREREVTESPGDLVLFDIARDGRVLLAREDWRSGIYGLPPGQTRERDLSWLDYSVAGDLSRDGQTLLFFEWGEGAGAQPAGFVRRTDGTPAVRLSDGTCSALTRDGERVICLTPDFQFNLVPTKSGEVQPLTRDKLVHVSAQWFPDERHFMFFGGEPNHGRRVYVQEVGKPGPRGITPEGATVYGRLSHDGQWLAQAMGAEYKTFIFPVNGGDPRVVPGLEPGEVPVAWSADDRFLYCYHLGEIPMKIFRIELASGRRSLWKQLAPPDPVGISFLSNVFIGADEKSYVYTFNRKLDVLYLVEGLH
ncbi:MAG TPA: protein kinase [Terriglobales bacterium]|nr:protein kinase [Terriglobales bacterium]